MARPAPRFNDFIGQKPVVERLRRILAGSQARKEPYRHCLFRGMSGLGKTRLARALANIYGTSLVETRGRLSRDELVPEFAKLKLHDFLFIDEAHCLRPTAQELLLEAIDNLKITVPERDEKNKKVIGATKHIELPPFTIVLATDQPGALANALINRMTMNEVLTPYSLAELKEIAEQISTETNMLISPQAARLIAEVSYGLPRKVRQYLDMLRLYSPDSESQQLTVSQVKEFLVVFGVHDDGLNDEHRSYLKCLRELGQASVEALALLLGTDCVQVRRQVEPVLLHRGLIKIGNGGRQLTGAGLKYMESLGKPRTNLEDE